MKADNHISSVIALSAFAMLVEQKVKKGDYVTIKYDDLCEDIDLIAKNAKRLFRKLIEENHEIPNNNTDE